MSLVSGVLYIATKILHMNYETVSESHFAGIRKLAAQCSKKMHMTAVAFVLSSVTVFVQLMYLPVTKTSNWLPCLGFWSCASMSIPTYSNGRAGRLV